MDNENQRTIKAEVLPEDMDVSEAFQIGWADGYKEGYKDALKKMQNKEGNTDD